MNRGTIRTNQSLKGAAGVSKVFEAEKRNQKIDIFYWIYLGKASQCSSCYFSFDDQLFINAAFSLSIKGLLYKVPLFQDGPRRASMQMSMCRLMTEIEQAVGVKRKS